MNTSRMPGERCMILVIGRGEHRVHLNITHCTSQEMSWIVRCGLCYSHKGQSCANHYSVPGL